MDDLEAAKLKELLQQVTVGLLNKERECRSLRDELEDAWNEIRRLKEEYDTQSLDDALSKILELEGELATWKGDWFDLSSDMRTLERKLEAAVGWGANNEQVIANLSYDVQVLQNKIKEMESDCGKEN